MRQSWLLVTRSEPTPGDRVTGVPRARQEVRRRRRPRAHRRTLRSSATPKGLCTWMHEEDFAVASQLPLDPSGCRHQCQTHAQAV